MKQQAVNCAIKSVQFYIMLFRNI